jgi:arylsulfatase
MMRAAFAVFTLCLAAACVSRADAPEASEDGRPNFLIIIADDLAYSDLGAFGGEVRTPVLDGLAARGLRLADFHASPLCSPTRAMLLTGQDNHRVGLGTMAELQGPQWPATERLIEGRPGYEGVLSGGAETIAERLKRAGYFTAISGKWHLGRGAREIPSARGFDQSFVLLNGEGNHYGLDQSEAWRAWPGFTEYRENQDTVRFPEGRYSADVFADRMIAFLADERAQAQPFMAVLSLTQPHWPLQAPDELIAGYENTYAGGPAALRATRLERMRGLGIVRPDMKAGAIPTPAWDGASEEQRRSMVRRMQIHAAMIEQMDRQIGRVLDRLEKDGRLANTYVIFFSDNGADGSNLDGPVRFRGRPLPPELGVDNSPANLGRGTSYVSYGPEWAEAGMTPATRFKGHIAQGGIRSPAIIAGPGVVAGGVSHALAHVLDIPATVVTLAGQATPAAYAGRSLLPLLSNPETEVRGDDEPLFWEQSYGRAVRSGRWKAVFGSAQTAVWRLPFDDPSVGWRLYDVETDPGELTDLADTYPERLSQLVSAWRAYADGAGVFIPEPLQDRFRPATPAP